MPAAPLVLAAVATAWLSLAAWQRRRAPGALSLALAASVDVLGAQGLRQLPLTDLYQEDGAKPLTLIPKFKAKLKKATSIVGFLNHLQGELKAKAIEAGCDAVMPRSAFSQTLPNLLRRYGLQEEEEDNFNQ